MPWPHCDLQVNDDVPCPKCGMMKAEWTLKTHVTRVFRVGGKSVKIELKDAQGAYVGSARYRVELPDGSVADGQLNPAGYAKANTKLPGDAVVSFPDHGPGVGAVTPGAHGGAEPGTFVVPVGNTKWEFRLGTWVEVELHDTLGSPCAGEPYVVRLADGGLRQGTLDDAGRAHLLDVTAPVVDVRFPERDALERVVPRWIDVALHDGEGRPVPDEPFIVRLGSGEVRTGRLGPDGTARVEGLSGEGVHVTFPEREQRAWSPGGELSPPPAPLPPLEWVEVELRGPDGRRLPFEPFRVRHADGRVVDGRLDERGQARVEARGPCEVTFPARDGAWERVGARTGAARVEVALVDHRGDPVPDEPFELAQGGQVVYRGRLGARGAKTVKGLAQGPVHVTFPGRSADGWLLAAEREPEPEPAPPPPGRWLEVELRDERGRPAAGELFEVRLPDGRVVAGRLGRDGTARLEVEQAEACEVTFPRRSQGGWGPPAPVREGPGSVEVALIDARGRPVPKEPFVLRQGGREVYRGRLRRDGTKTVRGLDEGPVEVSFPGREPDAWGSAPAAPPPAPPPPRWLEVALVDERGLPAAGEPFEVRLPDGAVQPGVLDQDGAAWVLVRGDIDLCEVGFPRRDRVRRVEAEGEPWLEVALVDGRGDPVPLEPFVVRLPGGRTIEGRLSRRGRRRLRGVRGPAEVCFPGLAADAWSPA